MRILVTGATGFIGRSLCEALAREDHELVVITRDPAQARLTIPAPHHAIQWDFSDSPPLGDLSPLKDLDAVIHLAGESLLGKRWNSEFKKELYHSRVHTSERLISLLKSKDYNLPKVLISASAIGIYGDRGNDVLIENSPPGNDFLAKLCQDWESAIFNPSFSVARKVAIRTGIVLGKGGGALEQMLGPFSSGLGGALGDGSQWMSWIHLDDLIAIFLECLNSSEFNGPINACSPEPLTNLEFSKSLSQSLNAREFLPVPKFALKASLGEASTVLLSSQRVQPTRLLKSSFSFKYKSLKTALESIFGDNYALGLNEFMKKLWLPLPVETVFEFFSKASNLEKITPPWLGFQIVSQSSPEMKAGTIIDYRLKIHKIPMNWRTEISTWNPPKEFSDIQLKGPYQVWNHTHRFSPLGQGTLMEDRVLYRLPMGFAGKLLGGGYVRNDVSKIFKYRNQTIYELFLKNK